MTVRKTRRADLMTAAALSLALSLQPLLITPASAQWIVYDPSNFSQNVHGGAGAAADQQSDPVVD